MYYNSLLMKFCGKMYQIKKKKKNVIYKTTKVTIFEMSV